MNKWNISWKLSLDGIPNQALPAIVACALGIPGNPSTIQQGKAGPGVFAERPFAEIDLVVYDSGELVYENLGGNSSISK